jgi:drug/metabolite transporter (DMT)-like permease
MGCELTLLSIALVLTSTAQSLVFKRVGFSGLSPEFILIAVSSVFVPIFFTGVAAIKLTTGGFLPETTVWTLKLRFLVIGLLNAANGIFVIFANPHVPGCLQTLLSQAVIPFTLVLAKLVLRSSFTWEHYAGALLIAAGIFIEVGPGTTSTATTDASSAAAVAASSSGSTVSPLMVWWVVAFGAAQLPAAMQSIYQEIAFAQAKVNVVYMMAWSSLGQVFVLLCTLPVLSPLIQHQSFFDNIRSSWTIFRDDSEAAVSLVACVGTMLLSQILSAMLVKRGSAALTSIVITLVTPVSTIAFTVPLFMGQHTEQMHPSTWLALVVMLLGIALYRVADIRPPLTQRIIQLGGRLMRRMRGSCDAAHKGSGLYEPLAVTAGGSINGAGDEAAVPQQSPGGSIIVSSRSRGNSDPGVHTPLLGQSKRVRIRSGSNADSGGRGGTAGGTGDGQLASSLPSRDTSRPALLASRIGLISSEYTAASNDPRGILFEHTRPLARSHSLGNGLSGA